MHAYVRTYVHTLAAVLVADLAVLVKIHRWGVQWKQGVVVYIILHIVLLHNATPIHCTPLPLHFPLMNTQLETEQMGPALFELFYVCLIGSVRFGF